MTTPTARYTASNTMSRRSHGVASEGVPPTRAACQMRVPATSTGAAMGNQRKGNRVSLTRSPADRAPYRVPVAASPRVPSRPETTISQGTSIRAP